ncbi:MAG TPA: hypothetical protein VE084_04030, partial [Burkholderiaceae bacterium]|nr:hypothetical protein [Burkholderiaceae bacterium]
VSASLRRRTHTGAAGRVQAHSARADQPKNPNEPNQGLKKQKCNRLPAQASRAFQPNPSQT